MKIKKFAAVLLAVLLTFALCVPAFATTLPGGTVSQTVTLKGNGTGDIHVKNAITGDTFALYKIVDITYNPTTNTMAYAWTSGSAAAAITASGSGSVYAGVTAEAYCKYTAAQVKAFLKAVQAEIVAHPASYTAVKSSIAVDDQAVFSGLGMGQYLIVLSASTTANTYELMTANIEPVAQPGNIWTVSDATVYAKGSTVTIDKAITDGDAADGYDLGETVNFQITLAVPKYDTVTAHDITLFATDKFPAGLSTVDVAENSGSGNGIEDVAVYASTASLANPTTGTLLVAGTNYTLTGPDTGNTYTFKVDFSGTAQYDTIKGYNYIYIVYSGKVNGSATLGNAGNTNGAKYTFTNNPTGGTSYKTDEKKFYTYSLDLFKYETKENTPVQGGLADAYFTLYRITGASTDTKITTATGDLYGVAVGYLKTGNDGHSKLYTDTTYGTEQSLKEGLYYLVETKAPSGYVLLTNAQPVTLGETSSETYIYNTASIANTLGVTLPSTGGIGTTLFTVGGILIILLSGVFLVVNRKKVFGSGK